MSIVKNPDPEFCRNFKKRLKSNSGYCPCALEKLLIPSVGAKLSEIWLNMGKKAGATAGCTITSLMNNSSKSWGLSEMASPL